MQNPGKELSPIIVLSDALWFPAGSRNEKEPRAKPANHCECSVFSGSVFRKGGFQAQGVSVLNTENRTLRTHEIRPLREIRFLKILQRLVGHAQYGQDLNIHHRPHAPLDPAHHQRVAIPTRPLQPPTHLGLRNPELLPKLANASSHCFPCWPVVRRRSGKVVTVKGMSFRSSTCARKILKASPVFIPSRENIFSARFKRSDGTRARKRMEAAMHQKCSKMLKSQRFSLIRAQAQ